MHTQTSAGTQAQGPRSWSCRAGCPTISHAAPASSNALSPRAASWGPKTPVQPAGQEVMMRSWVRGQQRPPPFPVGSGSDLQESKELGLVPCGEAGLRFHGDGLTVDFCCTGLGEGREVTAGPGGPGQLWPSSLPPALQDQGPGCPGWPHLPGFCPPPLPTCPACDRPLSVSPPVQCGGQVFTQTRTHHPLQGCGPAGAAQDAHPPAARS